MVDRDHCYTKATVAVAENSDPFGPTLLWRIPVDVATPEVVRGWDVTVAHDPFGHGLTEKQEKYAGLIAKGVSNAEACSIVGIHRRTRTRWRLGRTALNTSGERIHYPPVGVPAAPRERHPR